MSEVKNAVVEVIRAVAHERGLQLPDIKDDTEIVDELGFASLTVAALIANLEERLGVDPFRSDDVMITDIRTVGDLVRAYEGCLAAG